MARLAPSPWTEERQLIASTLRRSDNEAASTLFWRMATSKRTPETATARIEAVLADAGVDIEVPTQFGTAIWTISDGVRFFAALAGGRLLPNRDTGFVLRQMRHVAPTQRWGSSGARSGNAPIALKGGWGPDPDQSARWLVEQFAILEGAKPRVIGVMARSRIAARSIKDDSAFLAGAQLLEDNAKAALELAPARSLQGDC
ncbi:MAG: hypothetical protein ACRDNG_11400 [Gaiellaceae bacterium]